MLLGVGAGPYDDPGDHEFGIGARVFIIGPMSATAAEMPVRWDLSFLFSGIDDSRVDRVWETALAQVDDFSKKYRGRIANLGADELAEAIREVEGIAQEASKPMNFAELRFAADTSDPALGAFLQKQREKATELNVKLLFFELELQAANEERVRSWLTGPAMANYRHYLSVVRTFSPHRLSEPEEVILEETANTGVRAWVRLFEELTSTHEYSYVDPRTGERKGMSQEEVLDLLRDPDRQVRQAAADAFTEGLRQLQKVIVFAYNTLLQDKSVGDRLRKHPFPEHSRHLANELDRETVELVVRLCRETYGLVERFYDVKRQILGLHELTHIDRYAPLFGASEEVDWEDGRKIVLDSFGGFSQELTIRAREFFDTNWIDAEPRPGKSGGAFCAYNSPDTHPVIMLTYLNKLDDVMTLAHELGHGVHGSLSREQTYFNFHGTLPLAELASTFGEMLVFERIVSEATLKDRLALHAEKIEGIFATVFRQAAMFGFEQRCHKTRRESGELTPEQFGEIWQEELQAMFGKAVILGDQHRIWWSYIGHFFFAPFYVYAYSFGELLVLSLYQKAKSEGPSFAPRYEELLRMGGSKSPDELMAFVGVDLHSEDFWRGGFAAMERLVAEFERLWGEFSATQEPIA